MIPPPRIPWWTIAALGGAAALMLAAFLAPREGLEVLPRPAADRDVLRVAHAWPLLFDPHRRVFPMPAQNHFTLSLWEPLVECDPETGQPRPAAAAGWHWSDDRLTLTMRLRPDARWSNGDPVTAHDFVRGWRRMARNPESAAVLAPLRHAAAIQAGKMPATALGVEAVDDLTLRIRFETVRSTFVAELADPLFVPLHVTCPEVLAARAHLAAPGKLVTNGAFRLVRVDAESIRLGVNAHYRDRAAVRLSGLEFVRADNLHMARLLVAVGRADLTNPPSGPGDANLPTVRQVREATDLALGIIALDLNCGRGPLRDVRVRRALALALNRAKAIPGETADRMVPAYSWVPDMPGRPALNVIREDAAEARRLLAEAGYPGGRGFPVLVLPMDPALESYPYLQAWAEDWHRELGVRTHLAFAPLTRRRESIARGDYDIKLAGLVATVPDARDLLSIFAEPGLFGAHSWADPGITRLMAEADRQGGQTRLALLEELERQVLAQMPSIPVLFERRRTLLGAEVAGWYADPLARQNLKRMAIVSPGNPGRAAEVTE